MLSPDYQRRLAAIERQLLIDDPVFARRLARHRNGSRRRCRRLAAGCIASLCALLTVCMLTACSLELAAFFLALTVVAAWMLRRDRRADASKQPRRSP